MIDARNTFRQVNQTLRDFSPEQMEGLTALLKSYRGESVADLFRDNIWLRENFPNGSYEDKQGLCKIAHCSELEEHDWSLTPGKYVGYSVDAAEGFDYSVRLETIYSELEELNDESNLLMQRITQGARR